jgi:RNA polymerase sigma-70 factor (ECF subfamily)
MKGGRLWGHPGGEPLMSSPHMPLHLDVTEVREEADSLDLSTIHAEHADFVWLTLQRLGVRDADVEDSLQEVFVVVHRRLHTFDASSRMTTWLFGICLRVAAAYRRRAHFRLERATGEVPEQATPEERSPESAVAAGEARERLRAVLDGMELEERALFVMFEIDEVPCEQIAEMLGVPVGTVYSRLHAARKAFQSALRRFEARESTRGARLRGGET